MCSTKISMDLLFGIVFLLSLTAQFPFLAADDVDDYFATLIRNVSEASRNVHSDNMDVIHACCLKLADHCHVLLILMATTIIVSNGNLTTSLSSVYQIAWSLYNQYEQLLNVPTINTDVCCRTLNQGQRGRPTFDVKGDQLIYLRKIGMNWSAIAETLHISRRTLFRHRLHLNFQEPRQLLTDQELNSTIHSILAETPNAGERYVIGGIHARHMHASRWRIIEQLNIIVPIGRAMRSHSIIHRRVYKVKGPNYLWHMDSNHKLVNYRFVYHGCIDGHSSPVSFILTALTTIELTRY